MRKKTTEEFIGEAKKVKPNYNFSKVEYVGTHSKVKVICDKGHEFQIRPNDLLSGFGCAKCSGNYRYSTEEWVLEAKKIKPHYDFSKVEYINAKTKVKVICDKGHEFEIRPANLLSGQGCPKCASSKGEDKIREILTRSGIVFSEQKKFGACKDTNPLPFDFYIESKNMLIEFDGEQHFNPTYFGSTKGKTKEEVSNLANSHLEGIKKRDAIKTQYCKDNNIKLIRIAYTELENIDNILISLLL